MHTKDARALGETEQRLYAVAAWRDTPFFSERERLALEWAEELTRLEGAVHVPEALFERVRAKFSEEEMVALTFAVIVINGWNRLVAVAKPAVGSYVSPHASAVAS
jgi:alkylhydroperoxidase family enzyme